MTSRPGAPSVGSTRTTGHARVGGLALAVALALTGCGAADDGTTGFDPEQTTTVQPADGGSEAADGDVSDAADAAPPSDSAGTATVAVDDQQLSFDIVACARDLVVPEADGIVIATMGGVSPTAAEQPRRAVAEITSFGNGIASSVESLLPDLGATLDAGPVLGYERFETTDGEVEDRVRIVLADGTTYAAIGQLDGTVAEQVAVSGSLPAVSRPSGTTPTPYEGDDVGELTIDASCS